MSPDRLTRLGLDRATLSRDRDAAARWMDHLAHGLLPAVVRSLAESPEQGEMEPGERLSPYRLESVLGRGGAGTVYRAHDERLDRAVAIKFLSRGVGQRGRRRLLDEARAAARLDHPGIAAVHEVGETEDGRAYIVMAHCDGETLAARVARGPLPVQEAVDVASQIADALAAAHRSGIEHRDVKPSNVVVAPNGRVKLIDFGLAGSEARAREGAAGTPPYMSPERLEGTPSDARADVWSLGVVLYEMLAGARPFGGDDAAGVAAAIRAGSMTPLASLRPDVPTALADMVRRSLAPRPEDRYASAAEILAALVALAPGWPGHGEPATSPGAKGSAAEHVRRGRHFMDGGDPPSAGRARDEFLAAVNADPTFAPAWCGLSDAYELLAYLAVLPPEEAHLRARAAAERALELDPDLAAAHVSLATVLLDYYRDWRAAERHYQRALELDATYATGRQLYAEFLRDRGCFDEALEQIDEAIRMDPLSPYHRLVRGIVLHMARRPGEALDAFARLLEATPDYPMAHFYTGLACAGAGRHEDALAALDRMDPAGTFPDAVAVRGAVLARSGDLEGATRALERLESLGSGSGFHAQPFHRALVHLGKGDFERAITLLEEDADRRTWFSRILGVDPFFDPIREHPRFRALLDRVGGSSVGAGEDVDGSAP